MKTLNEKQLYNFYKNHPVEVITTSDGEAWACDEHSWNGERWYDCWQLDEDYNVCNEAIITPIYKQIDEDTFEIVDYDIEEV